MAEIYTYGKRSYYPHMKPADIAIWERFITINPGAYETVQYDVLVGSGPGFDTTVNPESGGNVEALYKRKIDVVAEKAGQLYIIEVKPRAGTSAIGQLLGYLELYKRDVKPASEPKAILLTDTLLPDMTMLAEKYGVKLIIV